MLNGLILSVEHPNYGTLFAAMIKGTGSLISEEDEEGMPIPFLTTEEVLKQLEKFGFIIKYDLKSNLPNQILAYLSMLYNLGYDKINRISVKTSDKDESKYIQIPTVVAIKSCTATISIMKYGKVIPKAKFDKLLENNVVMNITNESNMVWDWLNYMCNISDIIDENIDPSDEFETITDIQTGESSEYSGVGIIPEGYSIYTGEDDGDGD